MKRTFLATAALVAVFALCATTTTAQTTFINDDFAGASGTGAPGWSVMTLSGISVDPGTGDIGDWVFNNPGGRAIGAPLAAPFAIADSDWRGVAPYTSAMTSGQHDVSGAGQVLVGFDHHYRQLADTATLEAFDGSTWNVVATLADNWGSGATTEEFDATALMGTSTKAQIRFVYAAANFDWWWAVDNVNMFEPAPSDVGCTAILSPSISAFNCIASLSAAESISLEYTNFGSAPVNPGDLVNVAVDYDTVNLLNEVDSPVVPIAPAGTNIYTTVGTIDMSALGAHTLDVHCTIAGDANPANDTASNSFTLPGSVPQTFGYSENFDSLPLGPFGNQVMGPVPAGWENAQDDTASLSGTHNSPDWGVQNGTRGNNTANNDHTTLSTAGMFMWIEDSAGQSAPGNIELRSPCMDTSGAVGTPTVDFWYVSQPLAGSASDNPLDIDIINESTGGTVTLSVATFLGNGTGATSGFNINWVKASVDISAFAPDLVKVQFRTNNDNGTFFDDVSVDDFLFFDAIIPTGQAPQPGNAVFDVNGGFNSLGNTVASGQGGPYASTVTAGGNMNMAWSGQNNGIVICLFGPPNEAIATFPGVGQLDIGSLPLDMFGVPGSIFVFGDGGALFPVGPLFNSFFFTGPAGAGGVNFTVPAFLPGFLARFQCVMNPAGMFFISNAVDVTVN